MIDEDGADDELTLQEGPRWAIWIDIEGFSTLWGRDNAALRGLNALMSGIHAIGTRVYGDDGDRLFAHQFGDGFVIVSDFHEAALDRSAAIAVVLMRHVAKAGLLARAAIAEGEFADYGGCRPKVIQTEIDRTRSDDMVPLGSGLMTLLPVMGTALINANKLDSSNAIKGAVLTIRSADGARVSTSFPRRVSLLDDGVTMIDWVRARSAIIDEIVAKAEIGDVASIDLEAAIVSYVERWSPPPPAWLAGTSDYASLSRPLAPSVRS